MKLFVHKQQPKPWKHPFGFLLSATPLFFGFFIFIKTVAVMGLTIFLLTVADKHYDWAGSVLVLGAVIIGLLGFIAWVVAPAVMYAKHNRTLSLVVALNVAVGLFLLSFLAIAAWVPEPVSPYDDCIDYYCF